MLSGLKERIIAVRGNCEAEVDQMVLPFPCLADYSQRWWTASCSICPMVITRIPRRCPPAAGSVFLYGHTHVKFDQVIDGVRCLNPGSVSIPKDGSHSCILYEDGNFSFKIWEE